MLRVEFICSIFVNKFKIYIMIEEISTMPDLLSFVNDNPSSNTKAYTLLGQPTLEASQAISSILNEKGVSFTFLVDSDSIRHTFKEHGVVRAAREALRGQIAIEEANLLKVENWLPNPTAIRAGQAKPGKQPRIELELAAASGTTVAIMEWRSGRQQLALVTMYKKKPAA